MRVTLDIEPGLIDQLKRVAKRKNTSISKVAGPILRKELDIEEEPFKMKNIEELPQWLTDLTIASYPVPDFEHKTEYHKHLEEKYGL